MTNSWTKANHGSHVPPVGNGKFVNDTKKTTYRRRGSGQDRGGAGVQHWRWNGNKWVKIGEKRYNAYQKEKEYFANAGEAAEIDAAIDPQSIRFPADIASGGDSAYVLFSFYKYMPPFGNKKGFKQGLQQVKKNGTKVVLKDQQYVNENLAAYNRGGVLTEDYEKVGLPQLMLYMPSDIQDAYKADWQGKAFGSITSGLLAAAGTEGVGNKLKSALKTANSAAQNLPVNAAASLITNLAKGVTGDQINASDVFGGISGVIKNPNVELLFQKMNLRTFDLTFKMSPYDAQEGENIRNIVNTFKKAMLPSYDLGDRKVFGFEKNQNSFGSGGDPALNASFIAVPSVCYVQFMHGGDRNTYVPKYKMCAITDVGVNYTPDGNFATFQGGAPVATELKISFMETKLIFAEDITDVEIPQGPVYGPMAG
tara:strand:- start:560 stop:1831 length:1272 start_codon:yes stop_codon:yes gene_type:complete